MWLALVTLVLLAIVQCSYGCTTAADCGADQCCHHNFPSTIIKRQIKLLHPILFGKGTCKPLSQLNDSCDMIHSCGCAAGLVCHSNKLNYLLGEKVRRQMAFVSARCAKDINV